MGGKRVKFAFDYMLSDTIGSTVTVYMDNSVKVENFTDIFIRRAFGNRTNITYYDVEHLLEERCFPRTRDNCKELLKSGGIDFYDPLTIARKTEGRMSDDNFWLRFHDLED